MVFSNIYIGELTVNRLITFRVRVIQQGERCFFFRSIGGKPFLGEILLELLK